MSQGSVSAAQRLFNSAEDEDHYRSVVSRCYYAAYAAATSRLSPAQFAQGRNNPSHEQLPDLVKNASRISGMFRREIASGLKRLRRYREDADYRPGVIVDRRMARDCLKEARRIMEALGMED